MGTDVSLTKVLKQVYGEFVSWSGDSVWWWPEFEGFTVQYQDDLISIRCHTRASATYLLSKENDHLLIKMNYEELRYFLRTHKDYWDSLSLLLRAYPLQQAPGCYVEILGIYIQLIIRPTEYLFSETYKVRQVAKQFYEMLSS